MKRLFRWSLALMARSILWRYQPIVVGVTGSVGKTSTREAIATVLASKYRVRQSLQSYNNEFGVPLTILGLESPGRSMRAWSKLKVHWLRLLFVYDKTYPEVLVVEMGADKPGDIRYLTSIAPLNVAVLTAIAPTHFEAFKDIEAIAKEKRSIMQGLKKDGTSVLNFDDELVASTGVSRGLKILSYGQSENAEFRAADLKTKYKSASVDQAGTMFKLHYTGSVVPVLIPDAVGVPVVSAALAASAVGVSLGLHLIEIASALGTFTPPPGRLRLLDGIKGTTIIDDSYNSSPRAAFAALDILAEYPVDATARRYAVLGDMRELGTITEAAHEELGRAVVERHIDELLTVGEFARMAASAAREAGMEEDAIFSFSKAEEAGEFLRQRIHPGDLVLVKGSQDFIRLERAVKMIMAEPEKADQLLVRQDPEWQT